jgi:hypothetical protein
MFPSRSGIHDREQRLQRARIEAYAARRSLYRAARSAAVSPRGLLAALAVGVGTGRRLTHPAAKRPGSGRGFRRSLSLLIPLLRFF